MGRADDERDAREGKSKLHPKVFCFRATVPVVLELEVESTLDASDTLVAVMAAFRPGVPDPLLGANVKVQSSFTVLPQIEVVIARTRGAELITGIRALRPTLVEVKE